MNQYTHYLIIPTSSKARITDRYDWETLIEPTYPTDADTKADIQAFMATWGISGTGTKSSLLQAIEEAKPIGKAVNNKANVNDLVERHPRYFAKRSSPDSTEYVIKGDWTFAELKAMPSDYKIFTNEEVKSYISENWITDEQY